MELCNTLKQLCNKEENKNVLKRSISSAGGWGINQRKPCTESNVSARFGRTLGFVFLFFLVTNYSSANCGPQPQMVYNCIMPLKFMNQCHQWSSVTSTSCNVGLMYVFMTFFIILDCLMMTIYSFLYVSDPLCLSFSFLRN